MTAPTLDQWRADARAWLASVLPPADDGTQRWGEGEPDFSVFRDVTDEEESRSSTPCGPTADSGTTRGTARSPCPRTRAGPG